MLKTLNTPGTKGNLFGLILCEKLTSQIIRNGEILVAFPVRPGTRQGYPPSLLLFNTALEALARATRQEKERKGSQIRKEFLVVGIMNTLKTTDVYILKGSKSNLYVYSNAHISVHSRQKVGTPRMSINGTWINEMWCTHRMEHYSAFKKG